MLLLDEPFTGLDAPSAERLEALLDELAAEGRARADRHARRRPGPRLGSRAVPQRAPGRVRRSPRPRCTATCSRRPTAARSSSCPDGERAPSCLRTTTTDARRPARAHRPVGRPRRPSRAARGRAARAWRAARSGAGSSSTASPTAPSRWPTRCCPGSSSPRSPASRCCSAAPPACSSPRSRSRSPAACRAIGRDTAVAVVVTTLFGARRAAGALARHAAPACRACCSATCSASRTPTSRSPPAWRVARRSARCALLHARLLAVGFDRLSAPGARRRARSPSTSRSLVLVAARPARRGPGARQPARRRGARRAGLGRARSWPGAWAR